MFLTPAGLAALLHQLGNQTSPSRVMVSAHARARVPVEVFIEEHEVAPMGIGLKFLKIAEHWPAAFFVLKENVGHASRQLPRHLP